MFYKMLIIPKWAPSTIINYPEIFLSLSTGIIFILHQRYYPPLLQGQNLNYNIYSILGTMLVICLIKMGFIALYNFLKQKFIINNRNQVKSFELKKILIPTVIKLSAYLCFIIILSCLPYLTFAFTATFTLVFTLSFSYYAPSNKILGHYSKHKPFRQNKFTLAITYLITIFVLFLQSLQYTFLFNLHYEIFIIFSSCFLLFSYLYLQKLTLLVIKKDESQNLMANQCFVECPLIALLMCIFLLLDNDSLSLTTQLTYAMDNFILVILILLINIFYEIVLFELLRKIPITKILILQVTGLVWLNIDYMIKNQIQMRVYIATIILLFVLLINIQLFSHENLIMLQKLLKEKKKRKKKNTYTEEQFTR